MSKYPFEFVNLKGCAAKIDNREYWDGLNDSILDKIERKHWRDNPNESFSSYLLKAELNWNYRKSLW